METYGFNELEALRIAVEIERKGERHYRACEKLALNTATKELLEQLAREEAAHAERFEAMYAACGQGMEGADKAPAYDEETSAYLMAIAADLVFPGGVMGEVKDGAPLTVGRVLLSAVESEKSSLLYYQALLEHSPYVDAQSALKQIICEERSHLIELTDMLTRTEGTH